ncbi:putative transcription factor B3-Domain family [Helianthus annuus]|nr:putative transcription factor B3-Domain family [Helianthus annuus]KAJ0624191.1 putative transcription factor B3-Domain family [Helianthus annuus]KAJ0628015.1 putative transcription factor B3-Domain family [Helianthus annuus]KAJ0784307.1 putative transcription factor B3-Domain family [Helianthus annuus]
MTSASNARNKQKKEKEVIMLTDSDSEEPFTSESIDWDAPEPNIIWMPSSCSRFRISVKVAKAMGIDHCRTVTIQRRGVETTLNVSAEPKRGKKKNRFTVLGWSAWVRENNIKQGYLCVLEWYEDMPTLFVRDIIKE